MVEMCAGCGAITDDLISVSDGAMSSESGGLCRECRGDTAIDGVLAEICDEVTRAEASHEKLNSHHEAYAVILEELDEYWDEVRKKAEERDPLAVRMELIQTGAMCVRAILNVCNRKEERPKGLYAAGCELQDASRSLFLGIAYALKMDRLCDWMARAFRRWGE